MKRKNLFLIFLLSSISLAQGSNHNRISVSIEDSNNRSQKTLLNKTELSLNKDNSSHFILDRTKLRLGADIGLSVSKNYTYLGVGPQLGYQFNKYFMSGAGLKYYYLKRKLSDYEKKIICLDLIFLDTYILLISLHSSYNQKLTISGQI